MQDKSKKKPGRPPKEASDRSVNFSVRMPPDLRASLEALAEASGRSLNAEIVRALELFLQGEVIDPTTHPEYAAKLEKQQIAIDSLSEKLADVFRLIEQGPPKGKTRKGGFFK